jgi:hypothetical protein
MAEVRHERQVPARLDDALEQREQPVGVRVAEETLRPEGQRLGPDAQVGHVSQVVREQRLEIAFEQLGAHHQRVAAGDEDVADLLVRAQILGQPVRFARGELQLLEPDELRPAEAVRTVREAGLPAAGEEQHRLAVLVLHALEVRVGRRPVERGLAGGVGVEAQLDFACGRAQLVRGCRAAHEGVHALEVLVGQHVALREGELEERVVGDPRPVDEFVDDVAIDGEGEHVRDGAQRVALAARQVRQLRQVLELFAAQQRETVGGGRRVGDHGGLLAAGAASAVAAPGKAPRRPRLLV